MYSKTYVLTTVCVALALLQAQMDACKLFCEECPQNKHIQAFYCCQEDGESAPTIKPCTEWVCPYEPVIRSTGAPSYCQSDSQCPEEAGVRMKCCFDNAINDQVCKPAVEKQL